MKDPKAFPSGGIFKGNARARVSSRIAGLASASVILCGAVLEFYNIAWGTGSWNGEFSLKWGVAFIAFLILCLAILAAAGVACWKQIPSAKALGLRNRLGGLRWLASAFVIVLPIYLLQYTPWGVVLRGPYLRLLLWGLCVAALTYLIEQDVHSVWTGTGLLTAVLWSGSALVVGAGLTEVTDYPFSLGWSEGNRLWDYSLLFGRRLYSFDPGVPPVAYLDTGRQLVGGLPFLLPGVTILAARIWLALVATLPYLLLGLLAFWPRRVTRSHTWILGALLVLVFLNQGPIHAPLVISAILVVLGTRASILWGALL
ncbi:MAG TPA: hypothetical protein VLL49_08640, partial [Anaerolineales bacterium]|nr:hypothetical protein [Anaerolineales bacterium]